MDHSHSRCREQMAHVRQSRPGSGLGFQVKVLVFFKVFPLCSEAMRDAGRDPTPYTLHPKPCFLHPRPCSLHPTPYTLHPTPYTLHSTPYNLPPTPYILHHTPHTLHRTTYTLHPTRLSRTPPPSPWSTCEQKRTTEKKGRLP